MGIRITDLPVASTVNLVDVIPLVQSGTTKQAVASLVKTTDASELSSGTLSSARLPASGVSAGTFGSASFVPVITVDSSGRITSVSTQAVATGAGVSSISGGSTGLTPSTATTGAITIGGTLSVNNGGTGANSLTGYVKGAGASALTASSTIPASDLSGTLQASQFPALTGDVTTSPGSLATTIVNLTNYATIKALREAVTVVSTAASSYNLYTDTQSILYVTANATANWSLNISGASGATLASRMTDGQSLTVVLMATQGATGYYNSSVTIDGNAVTPKWIDATAPTSGNASSIDVYTYIIVRASGAFTVFASRTRFA